MERKSSPWALGLAVAGLLAVLLVGYGAAYLVAIPSIEEGLSVSRTARSNDSDASR